VLAVGQAAWAILDNDERALTPREVTGSPEGDHLPAGRHRGHLCGWAATELISGKDREFPPVVRRINR